MALNTSKCNHLTPLRLKGLKIYNPVNKGCGGGVGVIQKWGLSIPAVN